MTGIVFDIKRFALHDGPGIRTTVFMKGCPLRCWWCHNPESIREIPESIKAKSLNSSVNDYCEEEELFGKSYSTQDLLNEIRKDKIFYDESGGGVTFSGGEPLIQNSFLEEMLKLCKEDEINTVVDTSGYANYKLFESIYDYTDIFLYDLKLMDDEFHKKFTNVSNKTILQNLERLTERGNKVVIRIPLIPNISDTTENLSQVSQFISTLKNIRRIDLLPYNKIAESKYKRLNKPSKLGELVSQSEEELETIKSKFDSLNIEVTIRG